MFKHHYRQLSSGSRRLSRISPLMLLGFIVPMILALTMAGVLFLPRVGTHAAGDNLDCTVIVPPNPLSAQGLATPYQLVATNPAAGLCHESNPAQAAFVQGAVLDPLTGRISVYNPLVIDQGTQPAVAPMIPRLPTHGIVALWFGSNGNTLTLKDSNGSLAQGRCVNGTRGSIFGQFAYCNAPAFFGVANLLMRVRKLVPPPLGTAADRRPCPTVRDFSVVDMDQSDNVTTTYLVTKGQMAQNTAANRNAFPNTPTQKNASDNRLLAVALDTALKCTPWMAPDLADPGSTVPALPLNELQAAAYQATPVALVPSNDPMVLVNGQPNLLKVNAYRIGVDQRFAPFASADTTAYCTNLINIAPARLQLDKPLTMAPQPSPDPAVANSLFTFLAQRFVATYGANGLNCAGLLKQPDPITVTTDGNGVVTDATITLPAGHGGSGTTGTTGTGQ